MTIRRPLAALVLAAAAVTTLAQTPIRLKEEDVYFNYSPVHGKRGMCGFQIRGNQSSREVPRPEWDLNIDEIVAGEQRVAGISAGAFEVVSQDRKAPRRPRAPIVALSFTIKGDEQIITAQIVGRPNPVNGIRAMLDEAPARRLFKALYNAELITISLRYQDETGDVLQVRNWRDRRQLGGEKNNYFDECLNGFRPHEN